MLIDEVSLIAKAGNGGSGLVHFYSDGSRPKGGPDGGRGGNGGDLYFRAVSDISRLAQFRYSKKFSAQDGQKGGPNNRSGKKGDDLILDVPVGTIINYDNGTNHELTHVGEVYLVAKGGRGGWGNWHFRSSTNQTPKEFQTGQKVEEKKLFLQLKLIADIGLIGLPNAGKSSLLNELTSANAKVANYAFTTLEPNLGVSRGGKIIADIPGLIDGAAFGKGLGTKFLKHIERTKLLIHCLALDNSDLKNAYDTVRRELASYSTQLANKPEILILTKSDLVNPKKLLKIEKEFNAKLSVSIIDTDSIKKLNNFISKIN